MKDTILCTEPLIRLIQEPSLFSNSLFHLKKGKANILYIGDYNVEKLPKFIEATEDKKKNKSKSYKSDVLRLLAMYFMVKKLKEHLEDYTIYLNSSLNTISVKDPITFLHFYIYISAKGVPNISASYDKKIRVNRNRVNIIVDYENKLKSIKILLKILKETEIFTRRMSKYITDYATKNNRPRRKKKDATVAS